MPQTPDVAHSRGRGRTSSRRVIVASLVGNALEWYDFFLYGTAAALIFNHLFFPTVDPMVGTISAFGTQAVAFLARPIGGVLFGHFGDRVGRRTMLYLTLSLMGVATFLIGVLPTYASIGIWAPILLTVVRMLQGIAVGGEWGGGVLLISENVDARRRGMLSALSQTGVGIGFVLSALAFAVMQTVTTDAQFMAWGWRVPFIAGVLIMGVGLFIRTHVMETAAFQEVQEKSGVEHIPAWTALREQPRSVLVTFGARLTESGASYIFIVFVLAYATQIGISSSVALTSVVIAMALDALLMPLWGALSDRVGRRPVYIAGAIGVALWAAPFFWLINTKETPLVVLSIVVANAICHSAMIGTQPAFFTELFTGDVRYSGVALGHEIASVVGGGLSPLIAISLLAWAEAWWPVALYLAFLGLVAVVAVALAPETAARDLTSVTRKRSSNLSPEIALSSD
ncbi:MFS transporter [Microtetraspora sp. NBRC 16547]|uniref:MFS transporter n=1 Tax=Microtetraspora sp. NBRC 16547 TaxID=3030993 RepID=UPI00249FED2E|nr:MFS transporter [Microtetraspora sp. NBRC 16547]GLW99437.1 MFS transporter [Microtetraspora sp. NBRC 16547]